MDEKTILSGVVLSLTLGLAALIHWSGPNLAGWGARRTCITTSAITLLGITGSIYAFWITDYIDRRTLFEVRVEGNAQAGPGDPMVTRTETISVEHTGVLHKIMISPKLGFAEQAETAIRLNVRLWEDPSAPIFNQSLVFEPVQDVRTDRNGVRHRHSVWEEVYLQFTPYSLGAHTLEIDLLTSGTPALYIWVEDLEKTDGTRNPTLR